MHFSRSKLRTTPPVCHGDVEKHPESALRWLDSRLSFLIHVEKWAAKAKAVAYHLRVLRDTKHGPLPGAVRNAVRGKTSTAAPLHRESRILPVTQALKARRLRFPARLKSLDENHPVASRTLPPTASEHVFDGSGRLGPTEVFDVKARGALEGLKAALNLQESVSTPSGSCQDVFLEFQALTASHGSTQVRWVLGHNDIPGNEHANKLAKAAALLPEPEEA
ncbi:ATP-dependent RNA helicase dbp-5 [Fusarium oxysporum f. sp. albedinis]|nr:ATP-dependent RNA helicase dbp-5 [Fusarium oxysporum f. sp. albedinis]